MAGWNDIASALNFGAGLAKGFSDKTEALRKQSNDEQEKLLKLLGSDEENHVVPINREDVVGTEGFFGHGSFKTKEGHQAFKVGDNYLAIKPRGSIGDQFKNVFAPQQTGGVDSLTLPAPADTITQAPLALPQTTPLASTSQQQPPTTPAPASKLAPLDILAQKSVTAATKGHEGLDTATRDRVYAAVRKEVAKYPDVSFDEVLGLIGVESGFDPRATSKEGAQGLMQIMPKTGKGLGLKDPYSVEENIEKGVAHYARLKTKYDGNQELALAAYNAGEGRVDKLGRVPNIPETLAYVRSVPAAALALRGRGGDGQLLPADTGQHPDAVVGQPTSLPDTSQQVADASDTTTPPAAPTRREQAAQKASGGTGQFDVRSDPVLQALASEKNTNSNRVEFKRQLEKRTDEFDRTKLSLLKDLRAAGGDAALATQIQSASSFKDLQAVDAQIASKADKGNLQSGVGVLWADRKKLLASGSTLTSPEVKAIDQQIAKAGRTPEEIAAGAEESAGRKVTQREDAKATALEQKKAKAHATINGLADGSIKPKQGQSIYDAQMEAGEAGGINAATNERTADLVAAHKPLNRGEKTQFIASSSPDSYTTPSFTTRAEAEKAGAVQVSAKQREGFLALEQAHHSMGRVTESINNVLANNPEWQQAVKGAGGRVEVAWRNFWNSRSEKDPLLQQIASDLSEVGIRSATAISGLGGSVSDSKLHELMKNLPSMSNSGFDDSKKSFLTNLLGTVTGLNLPSLPQTVKTRMAAQQDLVRSLQDSSLVSSGGMTQEESDKRGKDRFQKINAVVYGKGGAPAPQAPQPLSPEQQSLAPEFEAQKFKTVPEAQKWLKSKGMSDAEAIQYLVNLNASKRAPQR
jgi:hypothetical protein